MEAPRLAFLLLFAATPACRIDNDAFIRDVANHGQDGPGDSGPTDPAIDSGEPVETGEGSTDTGEEECSREAPADSTVSTVEACLEGDPVPLDLDFVEVLRVDLRGGYGTNVKATRMADTNGDGTIDANDEMQLVVDVGWEEVRIYDLAGTLLRTPVSGAYRAMSVTGDLDPGVDGSETITGWYVRSQVPEFLSVDGEAAESWRADIPEDEATYPFVTDLDGDGKPEILMGGAVYDFAGALSLALDGVVPDGGGTITIAADLDRDGQMELISSREKREAVDLFDLSGHQIASCASSTGAASAGYGVAIGNLDDDEDGEIVAFSRQRAVVCDADGTVLAERDVGAEQPLTVALAELDGDPYPEIVIGDYNRVIALEHDLSPLWVVATSGWTPVTVADLDQDGIHEVIAVAGEELQILDASGNTLGSWTFSTNNSSCWSRQPVVADVDGDGLAEIVHAGASLVVLENTSGGWSMPQAEYPWAGVGRHLGDRGLAGEVEGPRAWWLEENVYNGLPAGPGRRPDLGVSIDAVCVDSCEGQAVATVQVWNGTDTAAGGDLRLILSSTATGEELGRATLAGLEAGRATFTDFELPASFLSGGLSAAIEGDRAMGDCADAADLATWTGDECP